MGVRGDISEEGDWCPLCRLGPLGPLKVLENGFWFGFALALSEREIAQ